MLELTGLGTVLRTLGYLYWGLAIGLLVLALWKGKGWLRKAIWSAVVVGIFGYLPVKTAIENSQREAFAKEAWAYFKKLCDEKSGEKIYKTFTGVKSVLVIKPLPPATEKDLYDQYWYGDPYSNATPWGERGEQTAKNLTSSSRRPNGAIQRGLDFVEFGGDGNSYVRFIRPITNNSDFGREPIDQPTSRFGVMWDDISTPEDRRFWVAGSRLRVIDLTDKSIVAERIGFLIEPGFGSTGGGRRPWLAARGPNTTCPPLYGRTYSDTWFISNVFQIDRE